MFTALAAISLPRSYGHGHETLGRSIFGPNSYYCPLRQTRHQHFSVVSLSSSVPLTVRQLLIYFQIGAHFECKTGSRNLYGHKRGRMVIYVHYLERMLIIIIVKQSCVTKFSSNNAITKVAIRLRILAQNSLFPVVVCEHKIQN